jgi:hypothetical protein
MPLEDLGSILKFAEELESKDHQFYEVVSGNLLCQAYRPLFVELGGDAANAVKTVQRILRERATEMKLEQMAAFTRASFCEACAGAAEMSTAMALETATRLEARADRYYSEAVAKIKALPEVSRELKTLGKIRKAHIVKLMNAKR